MTQRLERVLDSVDEDGQIRAELPVGDDGDVELACVGEGADADRNVGGNGHDRKEFEHGSAGEVEAHRWPRHVCDVCVHEALTRHQAEEGALEEDTSEEIARLRTALLLALAGVRCDQVKPPDVVALADREGNDHPCVYVALRLIRLLLMKRYRNKGSQYECADVLSAAPKQLGVAAGHSGQEDIIDLGVVGVRDCS